MKKLIQYTILLLICLTPVFGIVEVLTFLGQESSIDILYYKLPKDILLGLITIFSIIRIFRNGYPNRLAPYLFTLTVFTLLVFLLSSSNLLTSVAGLRWSLPFFILFLLVDVIDSKFVTKISDVLAWIIVLNLAVQIHQMLNMSAIRGFNQFGLAGRVSGFFSNSSAAGVLGCFTFYIIRYFSESRKILTNFYLICSVLSIIVSMSSTGVAILLLILIIPYFLRSNIKSLLVFLVAPVILIVFANLDFLTGRSQGDSAISFSTRMSIFADQISKAQLISLRFGEATNTAVNFSRKLNIQQDSFISDSLYTSILTNYGWLFFTIFSIVLYKCLRKTIESKDEGQIVFFTICFLSSFPIITTENFPINMLISLLGAYYIKLHKKRSLLESRQRFDYRSSHA